MDSALVGIVAAIALASAVAFVPLAIFLGRQLGILDQPSARKVHEQAIPRIGGVGIFSALVVSFVAAPFLFQAFGSPLDYSDRQFLIGLGAACTFVFAVGLVDDIRSISSRFKLLAVIFAAVVICGSGVTLNELKWNGSENFDFRWLAWFLTLLWIAALTVSVNFIDGLDGLASGLVGLSALVLGWLLFQSGSYFLASLSFAMCGSLVGFLFYNRHPAKVFMGDCGSMLLGTCMAALMLKGNRELGTMQGMVLPGLALSVPIVDCTLTFFRRHYLQRRSIFSAERGHIHHHLLDRGLKHNQAVWFIYLVSLAAVAIGAVALVFDGFASFAGLSLLIPLLWGAFRFAGSVRTTEMLRALRQKRDLDRHEKHNRNQFETLQLEFEKLKSFANWWHAVCDASERLEFVRVELTIPQKLTTEPAAATANNGSDKPLSMVWNHPSPALTELASIHVTLPVADTASATGTSRLDLVIAVTKTMEAASQRLALFSRLTTEHSLTWVRKRERLAAAGSAMVKAGRTESATGEGPFRHLRVALVHDFLYTYCGAERVVEQLIKVFPHCDVYALFDFLPENQRDFLQGKSVTTTFIQRLPLARKKHRSYLPLMPLAVEQLDVSQYDLVISSSYLAAKGVITGPDQLHISYCHSPVRYAWDLQHQYLHESNLGFGPKGLIARAILHYLRNWDVRSSIGVDQFIANSRFVARRIKKVYRRKSKVIHPPVNVEQFQLNDGPRDDFYLVAGRMVPYKRTEIIVKAFQHMPHRKLVVIGEGPDMAKVKEVAGANVELLGYQDAKTLVDYMRRAKALLFAAEEDFGIVPVEAMACGTPVIAYGRGGVTESVKDGEQGVFFDQQTPQAIVEAIERFEMQCEFGKFDATEIRRRSLHFSEQEFRRQITEAFGRWTTQRWGEPVDIDLSTSPAVAIRHGAESHPAHASSDH